MRGWEGLSVRVRVNDIYKYTKRLRPGRRRLGIGVHVVHMDVSASRKGVLAMVHIYSMYCQQEVKTIFLGTR